MWMNNKLSRVNVLAIVPARGGSKGVLRKNLYQLGGKPLIAYVIRAGITSRTVTRTIVSTDDDEIADVAKTLGAEVPFKRPGNLAGDDVPDFPVLAHAVKRLEEDENWRADVLVHLRPTYPLITPDDIDYTLAAFQALFSA